MRPNLLVLCPLALCLSAATASAACTRSDLDKIVEAIPKSPVKLWSQMAGRGLEIACPSWPAPLLKGLKDLSMVPPRMRPLIESKAIAEAPVAWMAACPGGLKAVTGAARLPADQKRTHIYEACKLARFDFATKTEYGRGTGAHLLTVPVAGLLQKTTLSKAHRRVILRALSGVTNAAERRIARSHQSEIAPRFAQIEIPRYEPYEPPKAPEAPPISTLTLNRVRMGPGCPSARVAQAHGLVERVGRACAGSPAKTTAAVELQVDITRSGAVERIKITGGDLGAQGACTTQAFKAESLGPAPRACTLTLDAIRPAD